MRARRLFTAVGAGITSGLLVAVLIIELLAFELSAIVGLPVGLLLGAVVCVGLWNRGDRLSQGVRRAVTAYATFGIALLAFLALRYVQIGQRVLTLEVVVGGSLAAVVVVYAALLFCDRKGS
jgi:hypothetical protein